MSFDWIDYYTLADELSKKRNDESSVNEEAACRSAVSRAYYAALHICKDFLVNKYNLDPSGLTTPTRHSTLELSKVFPLCS